MNLHTRELINGVETWRRPGKVMAGSESDHSSAFWDFLPTACDIAGVDVPENIDGISMLPTIIGKNKEQEKHTYLYWEWKNLQAVRAGDWKLFYMNSNKPKETPIYELYNLKKDVAESNNLAKTHPEIVTELKQYFKMARN